MRKLFIILFFAMGGFALNAQSFSGGLLAGMTASQYDGDSYSGFHRAGLIAGAFVGHSISKKFSWEMEMKFIQKGSYQQFDPDYGYPEYDLRLNYFEVPFLIRYDYKYKLSFEAGLGAAYLASHHERVNDIEADPFNDRPFHKIEISYHLGGYYQFAKKLAVNIRYSYSLLPARPHASGATHGLNWGEYNNLIAFSLKYTISQAEKTDE